MHCMQLYTNPRPGTARISVALGQSSIAIQRFDQLLVISCFLTFGHVTLNPLLLLVLYIFQTYYTTVK